MKKIILFLLLALIGNITVNAKTLTIKQLPDIVGYNGEGKYGIFIILAHNYFQLEFSTNQDGPDGSLIENLDKEIVNGNQTKYTLTFDCKRAYKNQLQIKCLGYDQLNLPILLESNQAIKYSIDDPEIPDTKECPEKHRLLGERYFSMTSYDRAKDEFNESLNCWTITSGVDSANVNKRIRDIDSLTFFIREAELAEKGYDFKKAKTCYEAAYKINPFDNKIEIKKIEINNIISRDCQNNREKADRYFKQKDAEKLTPVLESIINMDCSSIDVNWAKDKQIEMENWKNMKSRHVLTYEYDKGASLGISSGNYNVDNTSGYFTLRLNPNIFNIFRMADTDTLQTELNVSFGFTIPLYHHDLKSSSNIGVWLFFGPGGTMLANIGQKYTTDFSETEESAQKINDSRYNFHYAISPEAGLLFKIPIPGSQNHQIALRYTFQYRYAIDKKDIDLIGKTRHVFGIGFTF